MEPDLPGEPVVEREREWAGDEVREAVQEPEGWEGREPVPARPGNVSVQNAAPQSPIRPPYPVFRSVAQAAALRWLESKIIRRGKRWKRKRK